MKKLPPAYRGDEPYVFVCYGHTDSDVVMSEIDWLRRHGVNVWYDEGISPGAEWREELGDAIRNCRLLLFFVSPASIASPNCRRELNFALDDDRPILAIHLEETMLSDGLRLSLSDRQAIFRYLETEDSYRTKLAASIDRALAADEARSGVARHQGMVTAARRQRRVLKHMSVAVAAIVVLAGAWYAGTRTVPAPPPPHVTTFEIGPVETLDAFSRSLAISADGRYLAYLDAGVMHTRSLDALDTPALGMLGSPFFSPDGIWLAGETGTGLGRVPRGGGSQTEIAPGSGARFLGGDWSESGVIVYADTRGMFRVAREGDEPVLLATPDTTAGEIAYAVPQLLPGERLLLFTIAVPDSAKAAVLDMQTLEKHTLLAPAANAQYIEGGYLAFAKADGLHAVRFDADAGAVVGEPISLDIHPAFSSRGPQFAVSPSGTLAYVPARKEDTRTPPSLSWVDRTGREEPVGAPAAGWIYPRVSPDGRFIVADVAAASRNIQVWDLKRRNMIPLTDTPTEDMMPLWSSDGHTVYFSSNRRGTFDVLSVPADGSGAPHLIYGTDSFEAPQALTSGDVRLVINVQQQSWDLHTIDPAHPDALAPLLVTPYNELNPSLSPDGRWFAYQSDASGRYEVYVRPFDEPDRRRWKVSIDGGSAPLWSPNSDEIFFRSPSGDMMAASYVTEPEFDLKDIVTLFGGSAYRNTLGGRNYDISPADGRFLMLKEGKQPEGPRDHIVVIVNWLEELKKLLPEES